MGHIIGTRNAFLDEAEEYLDDTVLPPKDLRRIQETVEAERTRWVGVAQTDYSTAEQHFVDEIGFGMQVAPEGRAALAEEVLEPLRRGELTAKDAAKRVAAMRADLNKGRDALRQAMEGESTKWAACSVSPAEYQRALARRAPHLFTSGRGLLQLPVYDT